MNKNLVSIQYNYLNLPNRIEFEDGSSISYLYDAAGTKLRVVHSIAGNIATTDYCGNVIYENGIPKTLLTDAGFVSLSDNKYHHYLQDHQGNNRVVVSQDGTVEEVNHYYPFGGIFASTSSVHLTSTMGRSWIERVDWTGMIMEQGIMMQRWGDGIRWIRWRRNIMALVRIIIALIILSY